MFPAQNLVVDVNPRISGTLASFKSDLIGQV
jgi:hypothetical protein